MAEKRGRKEKYEEYVKPHIKDIETWTRSGATEKEICKALGIALSTFSIYKNTYPELSDALRAGRQEVVLNIKAALYKKATGYDYEERRGIQKDGETKTIELYKRHVPPDTTAAAMLLRNYDKEWQDKDAVSTDIKKREMELREAMAEDKNW